MTIRNRADGLRELENEVAVLARRIRRVVSERALDVHPEMQTPGLYLLSHLVAEGPMRSSTLASIFDMDKAAISRQVQHMAELGLIERAPDPGDGRATILTATEEGTRRLQGMEKDRRGRLGERLARWSVEDLTTFVGLLGRYNSDLNDAAGEQNGTRRAAS